MHPARLVPPLVACASHAPGLVADSAAREGRTFRAGLDVVRDAVAAHDPELIVMFGSDHRRAYDPVIPSFSSVLSAEGWGDHGSPTGRYDIPGDLAASLLDHLLNAEFDVAASRGVRLDHGFGDTLGSLFGGLDTCPILPLFINCATPPLSAPQRSIRLGEAVADFLAVRVPGTRVLVLGSGGLSHSPPALEVDTLGRSEEERREISRAGRERAREKIDPEWDRAFLAALQDDGTRLRTIDQGLLDRGGVGANEVRTWLAAWAAGGGLPLSTVAYQPVPEWITGMGVVLSEWATRAAEANGEQVSSSTGGGS